MGQEYFRKRIRTSWQLVAMNIAASLVNLIVFIQSTFWLSWINLFMSGFSLWVAWTCFLKVAEARKERQERINDILRGQIG